MDELLNPIGGKSLLTELGEAIDRYRAGQRAARSEPGAGVSRPGRKSLVLRWFLPNGGTLLLIAALLLTQNAWARTEQSAAHAPGPSATTVNYQGRLADSGGAPLDGSYGMSFALYDALTGGSMVWGPESHTAVPVSEGLFSVGLGSLTGGGIPTSVWDGDRYLEITVGGETLSPRELIRSVPVAGMALTVPDGAIQSRHVALDVGRISSSSTLTLINDWLDVPGTTLTLTPETNQRYVVYVTVDFEASATLAIANLFVDDAIRGGSVTWVGNGGSQRGTVSQTYLVNLSPGTHTLALKAKIVNGTTAQIWGGHTTITYFAVSQ